MRSPDHLEQELDIARTDLESSPAALKEVVRDKLDISAHAHRALEHAKVRAAAATDRALVSLAAAMYRARDYVRRRPDLITGFALGVVALGTLGLVMVVRRWRGSAL